jgi:hypothetical protein
MVGMSNNANRPFEVGYGRPPAAHRFKPGQSGNPRGRPKRAPLDPVEILDESVNVTLGGRKQRRSAFDVTVRRLIKMALDEQNLGACLRLLRMAEKYGVASAAAPVERNYVVSFPIANAADYEAYAEMCRAGNRSRLMLATSTDLPKAGGTRRPSRLPR